MYLYTLTISKIFFQMSKLYLLSDFKHINGYVRIITQSRIKFGEDLQSYSSQILVFKGKNITCDSETRVLEGEHKLIDSGEKEFFKYVDKNEAIIGHQWCCSHANIWTRTLDEQKRHLIVNKKT